MKIILSAIILFFSLNVCSQEIELICKGVNRGSDIRTESHEFPVMVDFVSPGFRGIRFFLVPSCFSIQNLTIPIIPVCTANQNEMECICTNSLGLTRINLSRITGRLNIKTFFERKEVWEGDYSCERVTKRKF